MTAAPNKSPILSLMLAVFLLFTGQHAALGQMTLRNTTPASPAPPTAQLAAPGVSDCVGRFVRPATTGAKPGAEGPSPEAVTAACTQVHGRKARRNIECDITDKGRIYKSWCDEALVARDAAGTPRPMSLEEAVTATLEGEAPVVARLERPDAEKRRQEMMRVESGAVRVPNPAWDCATASNPTVQAICQSFTLTQLSNRLTDASSQMPKGVSNPAMQARLEQLRQARLACKATAPCIRDNLITAIAAIDTARSEAASRPAANPAALANPVAVAVPLAAPLAAARPVDTPSKAPVSDAKAEPLFQAKAEPVPQISLPVQLPAPTQIPVAPAPLANSSAAPPQLPLAVPLPSPQVQVAPPSPQTVKALPLPMAPTPAAAPIEIRTQPAPPVAQSRVAEGPAMAVKASPGTSSGGPAPTSGLQLIPAPAPRDTNQTGALPAGLDNRQSPAGVRSQTSQSPAEQPRAPNQVAVMKAPAPSVEPAQKLIAAPMMLDAKHHNVAKSYLAGHPELRAVILEKVDASLYGRCMALVTAMALRDKTEPGALTEDERLVFALLYESMTLHLGQGPRADLAASDQYLMFYRQWQSEPQARAAIKNGCLDVTERMFAGQL